MGPSVSKRPVVLIVEDDLLLRIDATSMIEAVGFDVVEAASADDAIKILEARRDITVVFTDIQMPGSMDGLKLARAVRSRWPPIKIVATSGLVDVGEKGFAAGGRSFDYGSTVPKKLAPFGRTDRRQPGCGCSSWRGLSIAASGASAIRSCDQAMISGVI